MHGAGRMKYYTAASFKEFYLPLVVTNIVSGKPRQHSVKLNEVVSGYWKKETDERLK